MSKHVVDYGFFKKLCELPFIHTIYLFGSRARGDNQERSDIDLAIECPDATRSQWHELLRIIEDADTLLKIDCIRLDTLRDTSLLSEIHAEKILLYERDNHLKKELRVFKKTFFQ